jgi:hypothetical protein
MNVKDTITNWFDETDTLIQNKISDSSSIDSLCKGVLRSGKDYCCAVLLLLRSGHSMPAKALLRCLFELWTKLYWCRIFSSGINNKDAEASIKSKIQCWEKDTLCQNVSILEQFRDAADGPDKQEIEKEENKWKEKPLFFDSAVKRLPPFKNMVGQLPNIFRKALYGRFYLQFNNAVHLDIASMTGGQVVYDSTDITKYCVTFALYITCVVRKHYNVCVSTIQQECDTIMKNLQ